MQDKQSLQAAIEQKLVRSGEKDRLKDYLRQRLVECGWRDQMKTYAKDIIASKPADEQLNLDELIEEITPKGRATVPETVKADLLLRIRKTLQDQEGS